MSSGIVLRALIYTERNEYVKGLMTEAFDCLIKARDCGPWTREGPYALLRAFDLAEEAMRPLPPEQRQAWGMAWWAIWRYQV